MPQRRSMAVCCSGRSIILPSEPIVSRLCGKRTGFSSRGGTLVAAAITRFASLLDGLAQDFIEDPQFLEMLEGDLASGQHRNPTGNPDYFTTAFFHRVEELEDEVGRSRILR